MTHICAFLEFLKNIVPTIPDILEDTRNFLLRLNQIGDIPENALLVSTDVVVSPESLCKLANIVLKIF